MICEKSSEVSGLFFCSYDLDAEIRRGAELRRDICRICDLVIE